MDYPSNLEDDNHLVVGLPSCCLLCSKTFDYDNLGSSSIDICANCKFLLFNDFETSDQNSPVIRPVDYDSDAMDRCVSQYMDPVFNRLSTGSIDADTSPALVSRAISRMSSSGSRRWHRFISDTESENSNFWNTDFFISDCEPSFSSRRNRLSLGDGDTFSISTFGADEYSVDELCVFDTEMLVPPFDDETSSYSDADVDPMHAGRSRWDLDDLEEEGHAQWIGSDVNEQVLSRVIQELDDDFEWEETELEESVSVDRVIQELPAEDDTERGAQPASTAFVSSLPRFIANEVQDKLHYCAICKDALEAGREVLKLPCSHLYHPLCILPWLQFRNTCPVCRCVLPVDNQDVEERRNNRAVRALIRYAFNDAPTNSGGGTVHEAGDTNDFSVEIHSVVNDHASSHRRQTNQTSWVIVGTPIVGLMGFLLALWLRRCSSGNATNRLTSRGEPQTFVANQRTDRGWRWWFSY